MADLQNVDPIVQRVAEARIAVSKRPDIKFPIGNLNIINSKLYVYSGQIGVSNVVTTLMDVTTQQDGLDCALVIANNTNNNEDFNYKVLLNDVIVNEWVYFRALVQDIAQPYPYEFIVPPFTNLKVLGQNYTNGNTRNHTATLTGDTF